MGRTNRSLIGKTVGPRPATVTIATPGGGSAASTPELPRLYTTVECAARLGVATGFIVGEIRDGRLRALVCERPGRLRPLPGAILAATVTGKRGHDVSCHGCNLAATSSALDFHDSRIC